MQDEALKLLTHIRETLEEFNAFTAVFDLTGHESDPLRRAA